MAIARALAAEPEVLLLDEPLAGLDVAVAALGAGGAAPRGWPRRRASTVLITHDLLDVLTLADRVMVVEAGGVAEIGPVAEVLAAPRSRFGARIAGVNLVSGTAGRTACAAWRRRNGLARHPGRGPARTCPRWWRCSRPPPWRSTATGPHGSPRNSREGGRRRAATPRGATVRVRGDEQADGAPGLAADITAEAAADLRLAAGDAVWFTVKAQEVALHPARRGRATTADGFARLRGCWSAATLLRVRQQYRRTPHREQATLASRL